MILEVQQLVCGYHPGKAIIGPLSFAVAQGTVSCLIGPNGVGKTTLFKTVLGLLHPLSGRVLLAGKDSRSYSVKEFARTIAYVPQGHIPPFPYTVRDVVVMGRNPQMHELSSPSKEDFQKAEEVLTLLGIEHLAQRDYTQISGGERQLVMIARALAQETQILMMDEPTSHLDYGNENRVLERINALAVLGYTIIMITHVPSHAFLCADQVIAVGRQGFFSIGSPAQALNEEVLSTLYGIEVQLTDVALRKDQRCIKVCIPIQISMPPKKKKGSACIEKAK